MEKQEENTEKQDEVTENKKKSVKFNGITAQINLVPGSQLHQRWARLMTESGFDSPSAFMQVVMDAYENPKVDTDNSAVISNLEKQVGELTDTNKTKDQKIAELEKQLEAATNTANENAAKAQSIELSTQGAIIIKPNPVVAYFLEEMAAKTGKTPADILQALYIDDLQNPRSNNLPYTVSSSRIREVMEELKKQQ